jgi:hypothetical protein
MRSGFVLLLLCPVLVAGCLVPGGGPPPATTPTITPNAPYTPAQLKYVLLDHYGESRFFYCDPDYYPVGRPDEQARAVAMFPDIENMTSVFSAIVARKGLQPPYSEDVKLVIYREYKKLNAIPLEPVADGAYSFSLQLGTMGEGQRVSGTIRSDGTILSEQSESAILTCPICLAGETFIDTPEGPVQVRDLHAGMLVWTADKNGERIAVPVLQTAKTRVPAFHRLVHLRLSDGRELYASPGHPAMDGRPLGSLSIGDGIDGASVIGEDLVPWTGDFTCDILPAGNTGGYWANGIPLRSTLFLPLSQG